MQYTIENIGIIHSPYTQKFGIPRQPQLVPSAYTHIILNPEFTMDSVRGLDGFEFIWVHFLFHDAVNEGWAQMVRPPRLGGQQKMGVWATRSPHRPNHLGLSLLPLQEIYWRKGQVHIICTGGDLLDGTPVLDIKPYIPFVEAKPNARSGFVQGVPKTLHVVWLPTANAQHLPLSIYNLIEQSIAQDPRPAYQNDANRLYGMEIASYNVQFRIVHHTAYIENCIRLKTILDN